MNDERDFPDWVLAVASAVGLVLALPFAYLMVVEWLELVSLGGWFAYVIVGWAVFWIGFLVVHVLDRRYYVLSWLESDYRAGRSERRSPGASEPNARSPDS